MSEIRYKTLNGATGAYGHGDYADYLPRGKRPGKWLPPVKPELCLSGYHVCNNPLDLLTHHGDDLYEVEVRGESDIGGDKEAWEEMRYLRRFPGWNQRSQRLFAVDCARRVAYLSRQAELLDACLDIFIAHIEYGAAWDAAEFAARAAAWDAAGAAAWAAAGAAARAAAGDVAWDAAWAAGAAARAAEVECQRQLLLRYIAGEDGPLVEATS